MKKVYVSVIIVYKDDKREEYSCCDAPYISEGWLTLYPYEDPLERLKILAERISEYRFTYKTTEETYEEVTIPSPLS